MCVCVRARACVRLFVCMCVRACVCACAHPPPPPHTLFIVLVGVYTLSHNHAYPHVFVCMHTLAAEESNSMNQTQLFPQLLYFLVTIGLTPEGNAQKNLSQSILAIQLGEEPLISFITTRFFFFFFFFTCSQHFVSGCYLNFLTL